MRNSLHRLQQKKEFPFAIEYGNGDAKKFAGVISFHSMDLPDLVAEIGYWINSEVRGKGVGTIAVRILTNFGFETMGFERIEALVNVDNCASTKLLEKAGYGLEGILRKKSRNFNRHQIDMAIFSVIKSDWKGL